MNSFDHSTTTNLTVNCRRTLLSSYLLSQQTNLSILFLPQNGCTRSRSHSASYGRPWTQRHFLAVKRGANSPSYETRCAFCSRHFPCRITIISPHPKTGFEVCKIRDPGSRLALPGQCKPRTEAAFSHRASKPRVSRRAPLLSHSVSE